MLHYDRIDIIEGIDSGGSNNSKECKVGYYRLLNLGFEFPDYVCNDCHDLAMLCLNISNIAIITVKGVGCRCIIYDIIKSKAIRFLEKSVLEDRGYI